MGVSLTMWCCLLILALATSVKANCKLRDAKWKSVPPLVTSPRLGRALVNWREAIDHPECADKFDVWIWKEGQQKSQGKKTSIPGSQTLSVELTVEPCVFYNIGVDLFERDLINNHQRASTVAKYNSATLPSLNSTDVLPYFTVGIYKNPSTGQYDLNKASIKFQTSWITFMSCVKSFDVTGIQLAGASGTRSVIAGPSRTTETAAPQHELGEWEPYGSGRAPQGLGRPAYRRWGHLGGFNSPPLHPTQPTQPVAQPTTTVRPPAQTAWNYPATAHRPTIGSGQGGQGFNTGSRSPTSVHTPSLQSRSAFTNQYPRMSSTSSLHAATPTKLAAPFPPAGQAEIVVTVEPCKEYQFDVTIVTPAGQPLGKISGLRLPPLPDIADYVPPPFTQVVKVGLQGGRMSLGTQTSSPVPASCLPRYLEAVDAFAARLEAAANSEADRTRGKEMVMGRGQDMVEITQEKILAKQGCVCTSPRLQVAGKTFLYQGQSGGRPYYREDIEGRSLPSSIPPAQTVNRKKREAFIGNLGTTTTARPPWNYGAHGGNTGWGRGTTYTSTHTHTSSSHTSGSHTSSSGSVNIPITRVNTGSSSSISRSSSTGSRSSFGSSSRPGSRSSSSSRSTSTIGGRLGGSTPPPAPVPTFLYWQPQGNQWLMSPTLGGSVTEAEMAAKPTTSGLCPADVTQVWQTKEARTRSGRTVSWTEDPSVKTECKPDLMVPVPAGA